MLGSTEHLILQELKELNKGIKRIIQQNDDSIEYSKSMHKKMDDEVKEKMGVLSNMLPKGVDIGKMMQDAFQGLGEMSTDKKSFDDSIIRNYKREYPKEEDKKYLNTYDESVSAEEGLSSKEDQDNAAGAKKEDLT